MARIDFSRGATPEMAARANRCSLLGGAIGLSIEPKDAYYPKYDFRHKDNSPNKWYKWQHQRDWFWYQVWGRTAYNPNLGNRDDLWIAMFEERFGPAGEDLYKAMKWASMILPDAITSNCFGPDHRNHAPEFEWGDNVKAWSKSLPFDTQNVMSPREWIDNLMNGKLSAKATPLSMSAYLAKEVEMLRHHIELAKSRIKKKTPELQRPSNRAYNA